MRVPKVVFLGRSEWLWTSSSVPELIRIERFLDPFMRQRLYRLLEKRLGEE